MPSVELSKLPGISAARPLSASDRTQIEPRPRTPVSGGTGSTPGISVEVSGGSESVSPPVDSERVAQIRDALKDGSYPLVPTKIVDAMIAAQVSLSLPEGS